MSILSYDKLHSERDYYARKCADLTRALAIAHCLYKNDELTRLGEHLECVTQEKGG